MRRLFGPLILLAFSSVWPQGTGAPANASSADYVLQSTRVLVSDGNNVSWSPDGEWIAYDRREADGYYDVYRVRPDGTGDECVTCGVPALSGRNVGNPGYDPTGRYLVLQVEQAYHYADTVHWYCEPFSGVYNDLWALDMQTGGAYKLNTVNNMLPPGGSLQPHFSHDGAKLAWADRQGPAGNFGDWRLAVADFVAEPTPHLENTAYYDPGDQTVRWLEGAGWTPDDSAVYVSSNPVAGQGDFAMDVVQVSIPGGVWSRLTRSSGANGEPAEWDEFAQVNPVHEDVLAFISSAGYGIQPGNPNFMSWLKTELWLMNLDGSSPTRVSYFNEPSHDHYVPGGAVVSDMAWSPDGLKVVAQVWVNGNSPPSHVRIFEFSRNVAVVGSGSEFGGGVADHWWLVRMTVGMILLTLVGLAILWRARAS